MELMVVVAIISIIASIAYPSYMDYVVRTKRVASTSFLMQIADRQQQFFMDNKRYAADFASLGFADEVMMLSDDGAVVGAADSKRIYQVSFDNLSATTYTLVATPQLGQLKRDTECGILTLNQAGTKAHSGAGDNCW